MAGIVIGAVMILFACWMFGEIRRKDIAFERKRFEHTNSNGVLEFASFEQAREFDREQLKVKAADGIGAVVIVVGGLLGLIFVAAGIYAVSH